MVKIFIHDYHADVCVKLLNGSFPILIAGQNEQDNCVQYFLDQGVDVNAINGEFRTPLYTVVDNKNESTVQLLILEISFLSGCFFFLFFSSTFVFSCFCCFFSLCLIKYRRMRKKKIKKKL